MEGNICYILWVSPEIFEPNNMKLEKKYHNRWGKKDEICEGKTSLH